jgi:hypothetical protein
MHDAISSTGDRFRGPERIAKIPARGRKRFVWS